MAYRVNAAGRALANPVHYDGLPETEALKARYDAWLGTVKGPFHCGTISPQWPLVARWNMPGSTKVKMQSSRAALFAVAAFALGLVTIAPAVAQEDVAAFYKGKVIRLVVGIGVGSGYDINARLLAKYMAAHVPGQPTIIVQNQPGAGSLSMTNQLYATGSVRRHGDRRLVQRHADHAAAAADAARALIPTRSSGSAAPTAKRRPCTFGILRRCRNSPMLPTPKP